MKIILHSDDGTERDVTKHVQTIYDFVIATNDFGSGFMDVSEEILLAQLAAAAGFDCDVSLPSVEGMITSMYPAPRREHVPLHDVAKLGRTTEDWESYKPKYDAWRAEIDRRTKDFFGYPKTWESLERAREIIKAKENSE